MDTLSKTRNSKNHTLSSGSSPYSQYMGVPPHPHPGIQSGTDKLIGSLSNRRRRQQSQQAVKRFRHNPFVKFLSTYLLWFHCLFLFSQNFNCFQRLFLNEKIDDNSWNIDHVLQTTWKWSNWRLAREQDGTNVSFISHIHMRFLSSVISLIVLPTSPSSSSTVLLKLPNIKLFPLFSVLICFIVYLNYF